MSRSPFVSVLADGVAGAVPNCVQDSTTLCARVYDVGRLTDALSYTITVIHT